MPFDVPARPVRSGRSIVAAPDLVAATAGIEIAARGGNAVDAAVAASAALGVTSPHNCGPGGDLMALVLEPGSPPEAMAGVGRAGHRAGIDAESLRSEGHAWVPLHDDGRSVTSPGCVDGWIALVERHGRLDIGEVLAPAVRLAREGFAAPDLLAVAAPFVAGRPGTGWLGDGDIRPGRVLRRPGLADLLERIGSDGRDAVYAGPVAGEIEEATGGTLSAADLARSHADWVEPVSLETWGWTSWTMPPPSQGYLTLLTASIADAAGPLPELDSAWVHLLVEAAKLAGADRTEVLFDGTDIASLLAPAVVAARAGAIDPDRSGPSAPPASDGDTVHVVTGDVEGRVVSLTQSNGAGFGSHLFLPTSGVGLHCRGLGFSLEPDHPATMAPGRRPPHTLSPAVAVSPAGAPIALGTMGGDSQPQILAQLLSRLVGHHADPATALATPRAVLHRPSPRGGFGTWLDRSEPMVELEGHAPDRWFDELEHRGHRVRRLAPFDHRAGHAQVVARDGGGGWIGGIEPRAETGGVAAR